ncbi:hypothetical protein ABEF95_015153 [Exophiala dermatitidis]
MHISWSLVPLSVALAHAQVPTWDRRLLPRFVGNARLFTNTTIPKFFANTSTVTTSSFPAVESSTLGGSIVTLDSTSIPTTALYTDTFPDSSTCAGLVTYYGSVPPTVYLTVTEGYTVTVTASNVSVTDTPTLITPLPACEATIMPLLGTVNPNVISTSISQILTDASTEGSTAPMTVSQNATASPPPSPRPPILSLSAPASASTHAPLPLESFQPGASVYTSVAYTSTVIVTKKTPVPVVAPPSAPPDFNFQSTTQPPPSPSGNTGINSAGSGGGDSGNNNNNSGGNNDSGNGGNSGGNNNGGNGGDSGGSNDSGDSNNNGGDGINSGGDNNNNGGSTNNYNGVDNNSGGEDGNQNPPAGPASPQSGRVDGPTPVSTANDGTLASSNGNSASIPSTAAPVPPDTTKVGNIIASIINSPFVTASATGIPPARPFSTTINNVPILISPSAVVIGSHSVAIPTSAPTTIEANGAAFTVRPSEVIAPGTTIPISRIQQEAGTATPSPTATIVTAVGDLTFTIGPTFAVISETTYRIGQNAHATTITVDGTTVSVGPDGVGLPSITLGPGGIARAPFVIYTAAGLTLSVDSSEAVVSGTTYRIGSDAPQVNTTIGSQSVSFGPGGVGLPSTTIVPTAASSSDAGSLSGSISATGASAKNASPSASATSAASEKNMSPPQPLRRCLLAIPAALLFL